MVLLESSGQPIILALLSLLEGELRNPTVEINITPEARERLLEFIVVMKAALPYIQRLHRGIFYFNGTFYHIAKRLTGIHYVSIV